MSNEPLGGIASETEGKSGFLETGLSYGHRSYLSHVMHKAGGGYEMNSYIFSKEGLRDTIDLFSRL